MITNVPSPDDFREHGIDYLNIGWQTVLDILNEIEDASEWVDDVDEVVSDVWKAAERELATALSLVEQGAEFLLKSKICAISPWLLVSRNPRDWPSGCGREDVNFAAFRTLDAQDLVKVHDTFSNVLLSTEFCATFEELRQKRNSVIHTVDRSIKITASRLIEQILIVSDHLLGRQEWLKHRKAFLDRDRRTALYSTDGNEYVLAREFVAATSTLIPTLVARFFNFNKRQRAYLCPECSGGEFYFTGKTAQLNPNSKGSKSLHCFACGLNFDVEREVCPDADCKGTVADLEGKCLTCGNNWQGKSSFNILFREHLSDIDEITPRADAPPARSDPP